MHDIESHFPLPLHIRLHVYISPPPFLYGPNVPVARLQELQVLLHGWQCHGLNEFLRGERTIAVVVHQAEELLPKQGLFKGGMAMGC